MFIKSSAPGSRAWTITAVCLVVRFMSCQNPFHNENLTEAIDNSDLSSCKVTVTLDRWFTQWRGVLLSRISIITFRPSVTELNPHHVEPSKYPPTPFKIVTCVIPIKPSNSSVLCNFRILRLVSVKSVTSVTNLEVKKHPLLAIHNGAFNTCHNWKPPPSIDSFCRW